MAGGETGESPLKAKASDQSSDRFGQLCASSVLVLLQARIAKLGARAGRFTKLAKLLRPG